MDRVKKIKVLDYVDGDGNLHHLEDVIILDLRGPETLEELLEFALELDEKKS